jgi:hypothetical protein
MEAVNTSLATIFDQKFVEFANDLKGAVPEYSEKVDKALVLGVDERFKQFKEKVLPTCAPTRNQGTCPGFVLPGVKISERVWKELDDKSKTAIQQYLTIMSFCALYDSAKNPVDLSGANPFAGFADFSAFPDFAKGMPDMKGFEQMFGNIDMAGFTNKFTEFLNSSKFSKVPEKLMKGQFAKMCEELVKEFKPEDFGLTEEELRKYETEPHKVFELVTEIYTKKPEVLQKAIQKIAKKFQEKFQSGQIRPEQMVAEVEELMKEFSENTSFVELLESFRGMFDMKDMNLARQAGREGSARLSLVKERLKKKLDAKKAGGGKKG